MKNRDGHILTIYAKKIYFADVDFFFLFRLCGIFISLIVDPVIFRWPKNFIRDEYDQLLIVWVQ